MTLQIGREQQLLELHKGTRGSWRAGPNEKAGYQVNLDEIINWKTGELNDPDHGFFIIQFHPIAELRKSVPDVHELLARFFEKNFGKSVRDIAWQKVNPSTVPRFIEFILRDRVCFTRTDKEVDSIASEGAKLLLSMFSSELEVYTNKRYSDDFKQGLGRLVWGSYEHGAILVDDMNIGIIWTSDHA